MGNMRGKTEENTLYVQTFGGFSLSYGGRSITGGMKSRESQFIYLMELLLHERAVGVSRDRLEAVLFEDREIGDIHHATRSVIYNAKKRLRAAGLPDVNYIVQKDGVYYWTNEVPVVEDAREFEQLYREAEEAEDLKDRLNRYLDACYCYRGEFLPAHAGVLWVAQEAKKYRGLFCNCMDKAVWLLRASEKYGEMEELGIYAAKISPMSDWETVTMEALVSMRRYTDARKFYDDTVELYFREQGLQPSRQMMELVHKLGSQLEQQRGALNEIQNRLAEESCDEAGGYLCPYPVFQGIYQMVERMMERGGQSVYLMLCMVVDAKGRMIEEELILEELTENLGEAIHQAVRRSDVLCRYGGGQYLVLLVNTALEDCQVIQERISRRFAARRRRTEIQYYVNSVICSPKKKG